MCLLNKYSICFNFLFTFEKESWGFKYENLIKIKWIASQISKDNNNYDISNIIDLAKDYSSQVKIAKRNDKLWSY